MAVDPKAKQMVQGLVSSVWRTYVMQPLVMAIRIACLVLVTALLVRVGMLAWYAHALPTALDAAAILIGAAAARHV